MVEWLGFKKKQKSADQAKDRLRLVLIHDRTDLTPDSLQSLKNELISVISKYIEIDPLAVKIEMAHQGREQRLIADIPVKPTRHIKRS